MKSVDLVIPCYNEERVVAQSLREGQTTGDLGGTLTTQQVGDLVARAVGAAVRV